MNTKVLLQLAQNMVKDQLGRTLLLSQPPQRIVCLVPSITELLFHLGLGNRVVGITKFCIHPKEQVVTKEKVGGTKNVNLKKVATLQPDLIIANKEENVKDQITELSKTIPVYVSDVNDLNSALEMIKHIGQLTHSIKKAQSTIEKIQKNFEKLTQHTVKRNVLYLIWQNPYMTVGGDTFIHDMLTRIGCVNSYATSKRYPIITDEEFTNMKCDLIFLSSEPYPFREKHIKVLQKLVPHAKIILVDGEFFSWYGSKLIGASQYFKRLSKLL